MAVWMSGSVVVALNEKHPPNQLEYFIRDSQCRMVIATEPLAEKVGPVVCELNVQLLTLAKSDYCAKDGGESDGGGDVEVELVDDEQLAAKQERWNKRLNRLQQFRNGNKFKNQPALIVYTSGTTGNPKGVVHTYGSLQAQIVGMIDRWRWTKNDVVLHVLPLHHVHGNINALMTPLSCGACCVMMPSFEPSQVWSQLLSPVTDSLPRSINMFMAVPTIYAKLIDSYDHRLNRGRGTKRARDYVKTLCSSKIRLFVSGSAALPAPIMQRWEEITGHTLLERYGMTELGMVLTNPLKGPRHPGAVGNPFPFVEVRIAKSNVYTANGYDILAQGNCRRTTVTPGCENQSGELLVKGPNVFQQYWNKPDATKDSFTVDGWFKTGDTAAYEDGVYRILGRTSVDIIKSGGYKISALNIERHLLAHPNIAEAAVVGVTDITWGQKIAAVIVLRHGDASSLTLEQLRTWCGDRLPPYELPSMLRVIPMIPRNAMGKVNKKALIIDLFAKELKSAMR
jgi:malonyl-CoA/methylmalonyl-CoA synthetase